MDGGATTPLGWAESEMTRNSPDNVYVTKLSAARRQLLAAIRLYLAGEDELVIHTVASAAYRIIADLKAKSGRDEVGDYIQRATYYAVRSYRHGTLLPAVEEDVELKQWIRELADSVPISSSTKCEEVKVRLGDQVRRHYWAEMNSASNFLKHADRDATATLSLEEVDNLRLLVVAFSSYRDLVEEAVEFEPEGLILHLYCMTVTGVSNDIPKQIRDIVGRIKEVPREKRLRYCSGLLESIKGGNRQVTR